MKNKPLISTLALVLVSLVFACPVFGQRPDPIKWSLTVEPGTAAPGSKVVARLTATIEPGWHLYSLSTPPGPIPTTIKLAESPAWSSYALYQSQPHVAFDPNFKKNAETFENATTFVVLVEVAKNAGLGPAEMTAQVRYQACDAKQCLMPVKKTASATLVIDPSAEVASLSPPADYALFGTHPAEPPSVATFKEPVAATTAAAVEQATGDAQGTWMFMLIAFGFGLAAIFTPCVFPMIPITVSYFLKGQTGSRGQGLLQALVFSGGIIILFSSLGLAATAILGPFGAVQLGANPWVSGFIALVFLVFGLSLLGAFEITIPSSVLTRADQMSGRGGIFGALLMGLTFSLTAFACVGPFVGTLLAGSVSSGGWKPLAGMLAFSAGLALPFFGLALFPSCLKKLPRSGMWMVRVKVVLGFVILAAMLKYASNVDAVLGWNILTRERFLALWVILFALPALYLLGYLKLEGSPSDEEVRIPRLLIGVAFLAFSLSLIPGMFGGRLGEIDAYVPLAVEENSASLGGPSMVWANGGYEAALARGREEGKLVFLSFTGHACTNCHWMKSNMFTRPEIRAALSNFVLVELYTDGTDAESELNQKILSEKFSTIAIPFYAIVDPDGNQVAKFAGLTRDTEEFLAFLRAGSPEKKLTLRSNESRRSVTARKAPGSELSPRSNILAQG